MKFRVIQSNNRGLILRVGDKTFSSRKPKAGEEYKILPTLFIWVKPPKRYAARLWTKWSGEKINNDYVYEATRFRNIIDISGLNYFHQWSNQELRMKLWNMKGKKINLKNYSCPNIEEVWEGGRSKNLENLNKRRKIIKTHLKVLSVKEIDMIKNLYKEKNRLNSEAGLIKFHIDHIIPLSKGGAHVFDNLRIISAKENLAKGSKIVF